MLFRLAKFVIPTFIASPFFLCLYTFWLTKCKVLLFMRNAREVGFLSKILSLFFLEGYRGISSQWLPILRGCLGFIRQQYWNDANVNKLRAIWFMCALLLLSVLRNWKKSRNKRKRKNVDAHLPTSWTFRFGRWKSSSGSFFSFHSWWNTKVLTTIKNQTRFLSE